MNTTINFFLALFTLCLALAAIGGETWRKDDPTLTLLKRLTVRGWISIAILLLIFALNVKKDNETDRIQKNSDAEKKQAYLEIKSLLEKRLESIEQNIGSLHVKISASKSTEKQASLKKDLSGLIRLAGSVEGESLRIPVTNTKSPTPSINKTTNYEYDDQLRLFRVTRGDGTQIIYSYDDAGNRIKNQVIVPQS